MGRKKKQRDSAQKLDKLKQDLGTGQQSIADKAAELLRNGDAVDAADAWVKAQR